MTATNLPNRPATLRALLIDPETRSVTEVTIDTNGDELAQMYEHLGCNMVEAVTVHHYDAGFRETLWIDEEGRLTYPNEHGYFGLRRTDGEVDLFCGRGLLLATGPDGDSWPTGLPVPAVSAVVEFFDETPPEEAVEPHIEILTGDEAAAAITAMTGGKPH